HIDAPAVATIPARRPAARHVLLPAERHASVPAIPGLHINLGFIYEHDPSSLQTARFDSRKTKTAPTGVGAAWNSANLIRGLGGFRRRHADKAAPVALVLELDVPRHQREERVILALHHVIAGLVFGAALPHQNRPRVHQLSAEALHAQP